jgi:hypothetical protein
MSNICDILPNLGDGRLNVFPKELWLKIMTEYLNIKENSMLCCASKDFKIIYDNNNVKNIVKNRGFPRSSGHCNYIDTRNIIDEIFGEYTNKPDCKNDILLILSRLYDTNCDLVRGDKVNICYFNCFEDGSKISFMFDGTHIISYSIRNEYLPKDFNIIIIDDVHVPIDYWRDLHHNRHFMKFRHSKVREQCINNIVRTDTSMLTTFNCNNKIYTITAFDHEYSSFMNIKDFKEILSNDEELILFASDDDDNCYNLYFLVDQYELYYIYK